MELRNVSPVIVAAAALVACAPPSEKPQDLEANASMKTSADATAPVSRDPQQRLTATYARFRSSQIANVDYDLAISLPPEAERFAGTSTVTFDLLRRDAPVTVDFKGGEISSVVINGRPLEVEHNGAWLRLPADALAEGRNSVAIAFTQDYSRDGAGLQRFEDPEDGRIYLFTHFEPFDANRMFPCFDQPDLKATYQLTVDAPAEWQVVSAAAEASRTEVKTDAFPDAAVRWVFDREARFSTYVFSLHAGPYASWESTAGDVPLRVFARQSIAAFVDAEQWLGLTRDGIAFFNEWFDLAMPYAKYDQVIVPGLNIGAMENVAAVTFNETYLSRGGAHTRAEAEALADVLLHELSHMWFGNLVTPDWWDGLWLKESFATYMSHVAVSGITGDPSIWQTFFAKDKQRAYLADQRVTTHPVDVPVGDTRDAFTHFDSITYNKGASVLKQLAHFVGDDAFRAGVQQYLREFSGKTTRLADFVAALSEHSSLDLEAWSNEWLYTAGVNTFAAKVDCSEGSITSLTLQQTAADDQPRLRTHRVRVGLYSVQPDGTTAEIAMLPASPTGAISSVDVPQNTPCPDLVYPNAGDWAYARVVLDERTVQLLREHIGAVDDPLLRSMFWQSLWDMVRDASLPLQEFLSLAQRALAIEADERVAALVLDRVGDGIATLKRGLPETAALLGEFGPPLEALVWQRATQAGDATTRLTWFDAYLGIVHSAEGLARLERIPFDVDPRRHWRALIVLSSYGVDGTDARIDATLETDPSDFAMRRAMAAKAAVPQAAVKDDWLARFNDADDSLTLAQARDVMLHLFPAHQSELTEQFADSVLGALAGLAAQRNDAFLRAYNRVLPRSCSSASLARMGQTIEQGEALHPESLRALKVLRQEQEICSRMLQLASES
ncbi:MAG: aminopeptidase N [Pseudomonadota bacterium]